MSFQPVRLDLRSDVAICIYFSKTQALNGSLITVSFIQKPSRGQESSQQEQQRCLASAPQGMDSIVHIRTEGLHGIPELGYIGSR